MTSLEGKEGGPLAAVGESAPAGGTRGLGREVGTLADLSPGLIAFNLGYLVLVWAMAIGAIALFWAFPAPYTFVLAAVIVSSRQQALLNIEHECIHRKLVPSRRWNDLIGRYLAAGPVGSPYGASRDRHLAHHRLLATPEDPDRELHSGEGKRTRAGLLKHFLGGLLGGYAGMVLMGPRAAGSRGGSSRRADLLSLIVGQAVLAMTLTVLFAWWVYPALWLAPLATVTVLSHLIRSFVEHAVSDDEAAAHSNRLVTITSNLLERGLVAPYNMNYHAEHHIVPSVPAPRLPRLKRQLEERAEKPAVVVRPSYGGAILRYMRALRQ